MMVGAERAKAVAAAVVEWLARERTVAEALGDTDRAEALEMAALSIKVSYAIEGDVTAGSPLGTFVPLEQCLERGTAAAAAGSSAAAAAPPAPPEPEVLAAAEAIKVEGNTLMQQGDVEGAIEKYTQAIAMCTTVPGFYGNRAAAYARLNKHDLAIKDCDTAIGVDPRYAKGYGRKGMSLVALGRPEEARAAYTKALSIDPANAQYKEALAELPPAPAPSPFAALLQGNPAMRGMAESVLANAQVAGLLAGFQQARTSGGEAGEAAAGDAQASAAAILETLSSSVGAAMNHPQIGAVVEGLSGLADGMRSSGTETGDAARGRRESGGGGAANLANLMQGLLRSAGDGARTGAAADGAQRSGGLADVAATLLSQFAQMPAEEGAGAGAPPAVNREHTVTDVTPDEPAPGAEGSGN
eukprot:m.28200 g.28200  ORF g.28200 m.28200 type:complete len:414 (+) comp4495_c0_seq1:48-1289(+)